MWRRGLCPHQEHLDYLSAPAAWPPFGHIVGPMQEWCCLPPLCRDSWGTGSLPVYPHYITDVAKLPLFKACYKRHVGLRVWVTAAGRCLLWLSPVWDRPCEGPSLLQLCSMLGALHTGNSGRWESAGMVTLPFLAHQPSPTLFCSSHPWLLLTPFLSFLHSCELSKLFSTVHDVQSSSRPLWDPSKNILRSWIQPAGCQLVFPVLEGESQLMHISALCHEIDAELQSEKGRKWEQ